MKISEFDWNEGNLKKLRKHKVPIGNIEDFFLTSEFYIFNDETHSSQEARYVAFGAYLKKYLFIVFTLRVIEGSFRFRIISARNMHVSEVRKIYEKIKDEKSGS